MSSPTEFRHEPVMEHEIVEVFSTVPAGHVLDATLGGAGHTTALLESRDDLSVVGVDRDDDALTVSRARLARFEDRVSLHHRRFDEIETAMDEAGVEQLSGALFDLGVSSYQFDAGERGFSYRVDAPLDMRMDASGGVTAADIVNTWPEAEIVRILRDNADERFALRIARAVIAARPIATTVELAEVVAGAIPAPARRRGGHPAKRTFQALRIAVNSELEILPDALDTAIRNTKSGGRVAVLSYHSGEDRIVKERFRHHTTGGCTCPATLPCVCGATPSVRLVRVSSKPSAVEMDRNPRSTSARLRVAEVV